MYILATYVPYLLLDYDDLDDSWSIDLINLHSHELLFNVPKL